ncbi:MAG: hypothetical protein CME06_16335 [Gemmatimonadetes bacterium]|nr:hypothetical protein [Gemmatimonadota bacterium]
MRQSTLPSAGTDGSVTGAPACRNGEPGGRRVRSSPKFHIDARCFPHNHYPLLKALYRAPAYRLAPYLHRWGFSADAISCIGFLLGAGAALGLALGEASISLVAVCLLHLSMLLDYADGEVARLAGEGTVHGAWLEIGLDRLQFNLIVVGLAIGAIRTGTAPDQVWLAAFAALSAFIFGRYLTQWRRELIKDPLRDLRQGIDEARPRWWRTSIVVLWRELNLYYEVWLWGVSIIVLVWGPAWALWATAIYGWPRSLAQWFVGLKRALDIDRARIHGQLSRNTRE